MSRDNFQNTSGCQKFRPIINTMAWRQWRFLYA